MERLMELIRTLRGEGGCPWDHKQTPSSMAVYLLEEAHELAAAIADDDTDMICGEMGDVLFQWLFIASIYQETQRLGLDRICEAVMEKMIRRHPHVFGTASAENPEQVRAQWHRIKRTESRLAGEGSILDSIPANLPALARSYRVSSRAAATGFEWSDLKAVMISARNEWDELEEALDTDGAGSERATEEFGDLLFTLVNVARLARIHPETALTRSTAKFIRRFRYMEEAARQEQRRLEELSRPDFDRFWEKAKEMEKQADEKAGEQGTGIEK